MVVEDAVLAEHVEAVLDSKIDDAHAVGGGTLARDHVTVGKVGALDNGDLGRRARQWRRVRDRTATRLKLVKAPERVEGQRLRPHLVHTDAWLVAVGEDRARVALDKGRDEAICHHHKTLIATRCSVAHVVGRVDNSVGRDAARVRLQGRDGAVHLVASAREEAAVEVARRVDVHSSRPCSPTTRPAWQRRRTSRAPRPRRAPGAAMTHGATWRSAHGTTCHRSVSRTSSLAWTPPASASRVSSSARLTTASATRQTHGTTRSTCTTCASRSRSPSATAAPHSQRTRRPRALALSCSVIRTTWSAGRTAPTSR
ncbi:hypothetical protein Ctob_005041 [Chrysochromulina tobinii]|uniref:Uncharacterized protein n=1 Tax=Chrysochromulina tobinii TaxID=1460289 RepID=A0A0M0JRR8_9EUKA|nr:hypothetical protein Ctob_005041 [Chrysochromulina tobinii]|eukprot:KOO29304.1 hypothetical protein Ctob_005041 [Chrysochromulina sp. CCMP291]